MARAGTQILGEQALELACRQFDVRCDFLHRSRLVLRVFHHADGGNQFLVCHAEPALDRHFLRILRAADTWMNELLRHIVGERSTIAFGDHLQHHVERGGATRAGTAIAVDDENIGCGANSRKAL